MQQTSHFSDTISDFSHETIHFSAILFDSLKLETADIKPICYYGNIYLSNIIQSVNFFIPPNPLFHQVHVSSSLLSKAVRINVGRVPENNRS